VQNAVAKGARQAAPCDNNQPMDRDSAYRTIIPSVLTVIFAVLAGWLLTALLHSDSPGAPRLAQVAVGEVDAAINSMDAGQRSGPVEEARKCKTPLASVVVTGNDRQSPQTLRLRSGNYVSPPLAVTSTPQRVALPFPAPYSAGKGVISVEGIAQGVTVSLSPAWTSRTGGGSEPINVVWSPKSPC
jgi:hypothetical protein